MSDDAIGDDEVLFRRIPPTLPWFEPPDRISSANFRLAKEEDGRKELGLSVYRARRVSPEEVLAKPDAIPGSFLASATAGDIRALRDGNGKLLQLDVVAADDENDPGHAEIRHPVPRTMPDSASNKLRKLFKRV